MAAVLSFMSWLVRDDASEHIVTQWLFFKVLAGIFFAAFASLHRQIVPLAGEDGILPISRQLKIGRQVLGTQAFKVLPTVMWLSEYYPKWFPVDRMLKATTWIGMVLSMLLVLGVVPPGVSTLVLTVLYLSGQVACQDFLSFQWDSLLVESGFLGAMWGLLWGPLGFLPPDVSTACQQGPIPSRIIMFALRFLIFKLMLSSGVVKFTSGDPTWRNLTAMNYHYWTQPLPHPGGYWAHQLPNVVHKFSVAMNHLIECVFPFFVFVPWAYARYAAFLGFTGLQFMILATGNYGFFNWLTVVLSLPLLDDSLFVSQPCAAPADHGVGVLTVANFLITLAFAVGLTSLSFVALTRAFREYWRYPFPHHLKKAYNFVASMRLVNGYGLFASMTTDRQEVNIEGSMDGKNWVSYPFKYKPVTLDGPLSVLLFHMPRLDWRMWFLFPARRRECPPWLDELLAKLMEGSPTVLSLFAADPFCGEKPRAVRAVWWYYYFTRTSLPPKEPKPATYWRREGVLGEKSPPDGGPPFVLAVRPRVLFPRNMGPYYYMPDASESESEGTPAPSEPESEQAIAG